MPKWIQLSATWFGLGYLKPAPGTWGTLGAIPLAALLMRLSPVAYMAVTILFAALAIFIAHLYEKQVEGHDASEIVIDEVAGFLVTMAWLPLTWQSFLLGFVVFRVLDAVKPPPISWADRRIRGGVGVVADDLIAGILANAVLQFLFVQTSWLGYQLRG